jgi:hypothetical protein
MSNHYHVVLETHEGNLSTGMRQLNGGYTQRFNRRHGRVGHVLQGRYKAILVDRDTYLLALARSVVLNPMRAGMVTHPGQWPWSSYQATVGQSQAPDWLTTDWVLRQFGRTRALAQARYAQFVCDGSTQSSIWRGLRQQIYLGDQHFIAQMQAHIKAEGILDEVPQIQRRVPRKSLPDFASEHADRRPAMAAAYLSGVYTMKTIGAYFGVHYSTVSRAVRDTERKKATE